jgi:hypothetical protein
MSTPSAAALELTGIIVSTQLAVILVLILVVGPILYWIFRALTGRLGR